MENLRFLIPVCGETADEDAIRLACRLSRKGKGRLYVVYVIEVKRSLPLDAESEADTEKGEAVLARAEALADTLDCDVETELLHAREVGPAIVDEAVERNVDMIVMGTSYRRRFGEFDMGTTLPYVFKNAPCRVVLWREPIGQGDK